MLLPVFIFLYNLFFFFKYNSLCSFKKKIMTNMVTYNKVTSLINCDLFGVLVSSSEHLWNCEGVHYL